MRFVYVGQLGTDDADTYFFNQIVSLFVMANGRWRMTGIGNVPERDVGATLGKSIGCSAVDADGEGGKIVVSAMAAAGYPCSHEAAGYTAQRIESESSGRRLLTPRQPIKEVVISVGR